MRHREWALAYVLCAIVALNVIAIVLLSGRLQAPTPAPAVAPPARPPVRAVVLEDSRCQDCFEIRQYATALVDAMALETETGDLAEWEGRLAGRLPAIAFNASIEMYPRLVNDWTTVGYTVAFDSGPYAGAWYVLPTLNPPYIDLATGEVRGRVTVTYLTAGSCAECYDPRDLRYFINASRIVPYRELSVDEASPDGRAIVEAYNITRVPTILLSPEAAEYPGFLPGWSVVGTVEGDGTLVLRDLERIGLAYLDLGTGRVMKP